MEKRITQSAIALVLGMGALGLLSWIINIPFLSHGTEGSHDPITINTALCLVLSALVLWLLQSEHLSQRWYRAAQGLAITVALVGGLTLVQYFLDWSLGIDQWFVNLVPVVVSSQSAVRMEFNTAINLFFIGIALLLLSQQTHRSLWLSQTLSCIASLVAWVALLDQSLYAQLTPFHGVAPRIAPRIAPIVAPMFSMSLFTAVAMIILCVGLLWFHPRHGLMQIVYSPLAGGVMARQILPWAIILPIFLSWLFQQGKVLSWFDGHSSKRFEAIALAISFAIVVCRNAWLLNRFELQRLKTESDLNLAHERRIQAAERNISLQQETQRLASVIKIQEEISLHGSNLDAVMNLIVNRAQQLTGANGAAIETLDGDELVYRAATGLGSSSRLGLRLKVNASLSGECLKQGKILCCQDIATDERVNRQACEQLGIQSMIVAPLAQNGVHTGVLKVFSKTRYGFSPQDIQALQLITVFLANTLQLAAEFHEKAVLFDALEESEARYRSVIDALSEGIVMQDDSFNIRATNTSAHQILGLTFDQMMGFTSLGMGWQAIHEDGQPFDPEELPAMVALRTGEPCRNIVMGVQKPNDPLIWISVNAQPMCHPGETIPFAVVSSFYDITERKQLEQALFQEKELAQVTLHSIGDAVITTDAAGRIQYFNPVAATLTGWNPCDTYGVPLIDVFQVIDEMTGILIENPVTKALQEGEIVALDNHAVLIARDGREIPIEDSAAPIRDRKGQLIGAVMVFHDVTQTRQLSRQLTWEASHDPLTRLFNRREFEHRVKQALSSAHTEHHEHVLCYLDLDQFKIVNDTCGHTAGDELLRQIATLLQTQIRKSDTLARLGGDEFGVLLQDCPLDQAQRIANQIRDAIQMFRFLWQDQSFTVGVSIGLVQVNATSDNLSTLLSAADAACYAAKNKGRNRIHLFHPQDQDLLKQRSEMQWAARIQNALVEDRFCLYYQPILRVNAPEVHPPQSQSPQSQSPQYEVFIRLLDEQGNLVLPMAFIPAAERYNLMHLIDRWVIRHLFTTQAHHCQEVWQSQQNSSIHHSSTSNGFTSNSAIASNYLYAINLSSASVNDDQFIPFLSEQLSLHNIPPHLICFEITETLAIANLTTVVQFIHAVQRLGCRVALDDFGGGMSSFSYLKTLPINYLKIDGGFIRNIVLNPVDDAMVEAMTHISHVMGITLIAEFVENDAILARVKRLGIDYAQGYGIAKPRPFSTTPQGRLERTHQR